LFLNLSKHTIPSLFFIGALFFVTSCENQQLPVAAVNPINTIDIVEDHSEVLVEWIKAGYRDMVLINIDHHDDFRAIPEHKIKRLKNLYNDKSGMNYPESIRNKSIMEADMPGQKSFQD